MYSNSDYAEQLYKLLPPGKWITNIPGSTANLLLLGLASEYARIDDFLNDIITEANPLTTNKLLQERYEEAGLPDCTGIVPPTAEAKRQQILLRWRSGSGFTKQSMLDLLASLNIPATIFEYYVDSSLATSTSDCTGIIYDEVKVGHFIITYVDADTIDFIPAASTAGEPLGDFGTVLYKFQCYINKMRPAHLVAEYNPVTSL